jgi:hypothetical protein
MLRQETVDMGNAEQAVAWAMQFMPTLNGMPALIPSEFLAVWSKHLVEAGFCHVDYVRRMADEDGNIHVSKLPRQRIKLSPPIRGSRHGLNNAWRWVDMDEPDPEPIRLPDITELQPNEQAALLSQFAEAGMIPAAASQFAGGVEE